MKTVSNRQILAKVAGGADEKGGGITRGEFITGAGAIGGGVAASKVVTAAGGWAALSPAVMGPVYVASFTGVGTAAAAGYTAGTVLYHNSDLVQSGSQAAVGAVMDAFKAIGNWLSGDGVPAPSGGDDLSQVLAKRNRK
ncbi:MAG: hypothetical protein V4723_02125 [Pseudomonadota bacterium]